MEEQAFRQPLCNVGQAFGVGSRFVQSCFQLVLHVTLIQQGRPPKEEAILLAPRFLGIDEFARRKEHVYGTILCDLQERQVLEVSEGREHWKRCVALLKRAETPILIIECIAFNSLPFNAVSAAAWQAHTFLENG